MGPATVYQNGRFFTSEETGKSAVFFNTMIVQDSLITHIGSATDAAVGQAKAQQATATVDMRGRTILPGFIDGHMHLLLLGLALQKLNLEPCRDLNDIRAAIKAYAAAHPALPRILCRGWMHPMTRGVALASMLDDLDPRPIFIDSKDLHSTWCSTAALEELGAAGRADPAGGKIHRDESGKPSGLLSETAAQLLVWPHVARCASPKEKMDALREAVTAYTAAGYTGMVDMAMDENAWEAVQLLRSSENFPIRLAAYWLIQPSDDEKANLAQVDRAIALHKQFNAETSPDCRIAGIKIICDGVIDACTAALCEPYSSNGASPEPLWTAAQLQPVIRHAAAANLQCALHAIGDRAISLAIDALAPVCSTSPAPSRRHRIEHLELASATDAARLGKLGITASIQPVHADPAILRAWPKLLGTHRCARAFPYNEFLASGAALALGSDSPTAPHGPLLNLYTATTRRSARDPGSVEVVNERAALSLATAVAAATAGAAYSCFAEERTGSLRVGLRADFVVLEMEWEPQRLLGAKVCETWFDGRKVYDAEG